MKSLCKVMGMRALHARRLGSALAWGLRAKDVSFVTMLAEKYVIRGGGGSRIRLGWGRGWGQVTARGGNLRGELWRKDPGSTGTYAVGMEQGRGRTSNLVSWGGGRRKVEQRVWDQPADSTC